MRWDLRPDDWRTHWPELIETEGAPVPFVTAEPANAAEAAGTAPGTAAEPTRSARASVGRRATDAKVEASDA